MFYEDSNVGIISPLLLMPGNIGILWTMYTPESVLASYAIIPFEWAPPLYFLPPF